MHHPREKVGCSPPFSSLATFRGTRCHVSKILLQFRDSSFTRDTRAAMMHREHPSFDRQAAVDYRLVFFNLNLVFREEETMHHVE